MPSRNYIKKITVRVFHCFAGILDSLKKNLGVLIDYRPSSVWAMAQTSPKIFSFKHGQGEKTKKKNKNLSFTLW